MKNPLGKYIYKKRTQDRKEDIRGPFFRDQTAIIHSLPFRRLKHKTQVFFSPKNDHVCTRIEHVMHVATIGATICKGLNKNGWQLDGEMAFAIGLAHDLGHAPFGHAGETALNAMLKDSVFIHEVNSYRVVEYLADLNLTYGVKDGVICHNGELFEQCLEPKNTINDLYNIRDRNCIPSSFEGCIVRFSDKIAYLGRDIEDAVSAGLITQNDIPAAIRRELGCDNGEIINNLVIDIINSSKDSNKIEFSDDKFDLLVKLKKFNYEKIYNHKKNLQYLNSSKKVVEILFEYLMDRYLKYSDDFLAYSNSSMELDRWFGEFLAKMSLLYEQERTKPEKIIVDYIAGMTDSHALKCVKKIIIPAPII
jgi:dGTPase